MRISDWSSDVCSSDLTHCLILRRMEPIASGSGWDVTPRAHPAAMDQMGRDARLALLASRQAGAFTFQQALTVGYPRATTSRRIPSGHWQKRNPGVYVIGGPEPSRLLDLWDGVLHLAPDGLPQ